MRPPDSRGAPPNVVGYLLDDAQAALAGAGWAEADISETRPPRQPLTGPQRVLRQRVVGPGRIALVVGGERPTASSRGGTPA
jgi:hypothetical protein